MVVEQANGLACLHHTFVWLQVVAAVNSLNAWKAQLASLKERLEKELEAARAAFPDDEDE
jgi:hypothetical protein